MKISILELLPNIKKTRKFFETGKKKNHSKGLPKFEANPI